MPASHHYDADFLRYTRASSGYSADRITSFVAHALKPTSVLDVGCAAGTWVAKWLQTGIPDVHGIDGITDGSQLVIDQQHFTSADISKRFDMGRTFDLVTCLEVAEHINPDESATLMDNITRHAGRFVLFSAAVPGQGGEHHINERSYDYWRSRFEAWGFSTYDYVRPPFAYDPHIAFWYRYNILLYVRHEFAGDLPEVVAKTWLRPGTRVLDVSPLLFRVRKALVRMLPIGLVTWLSRIRSRAA